MRASGGQGPRTYTFLYTDIVGSSRLWEADPVAMAAALEAHNSLLTAAAEGTGGRVFKSLGDGLGCVFDSADCAVLCAVRMQREIQSAELAVELEIRVGIHAGTAHPIGADFGGPVLNRVSRITDLAEAGQIFISESARSLALDYTPADIRFEMLGEIALEGMSRPERLYGVVAEGIALASRVDVASQLPPSNLEPLDGPFIGRAREREDLVHRLTKTDQRFITIVGFGGMGKTTLAKQCGLDVLDHFGGRVYWIECEAIRTMEELAATVSLALGEAADGERAVSIIRDIIGETPAVLIFDCFERVVALSGLVESLLRRCPALKVVVTSRVVLGVKTEFLVELGGMSGKPSDGVESDAIALFRSHAAKHSPSFGTAGADRIVARRLVQDLEFVPLAIVICAGRLRYTPIKTLREQVKASLLGTVRSVRDQEGRHSGLGRVIQMSFDMLADFDKRALTALSVFEGSFSVETAEAILGPTLGLIKDHVFRLRDHSLVVQTEDGRFRLLDSVREFLLDQHEVDDRAAIADAHASYYLSVASRIRGLTDRQDWPGALLLWRTEGPNLRRAVDHSITTGYFVADFAKSLARVMLESGQYGELERIVIGGIEAARKAHDGHLEIELLGFLGTLQRRLGQLRLASNTYRTQADLCDLLDLPILQADALCDLSLTCLEAEDLICAEAALSEAASLGEAVGINVYAIHAVKGLFEARSGRLSEALALAQEVEAAAVKMEAMFVSLARPLCQIYRQCFLNDRAIKTACSFLSLALKHGNVTAVAVALEELTSSLIEANRLDLAVSSVACIHVIPSRLAPSAHPRYARLSAVLKGLGCADQLDLYRRTLSGKSWETCATEHAEVVASWLARSTSPRLGGGDVVLY